MPIESIKLQSKHNGRNFNGKGDYIARLTGRHPTMTFQREFLGKDVIVDAVGVYETCDIVRDGSKGQRYCIIILAPNGDLAKLRMRADYVGDKEEEVDGKALAMRLMKRMDDGERLEDMIQVVPSADGVAPWSYHILSKKEAVAGIKSATIESATAGCWEHLKLMDEKSAKRVLKGLKELVSPPKPEMTQDIATDEQTVTADLTEGKTPMTDSTLGS